MSSSGLIPGKALRLPAAVLAAGLLVLAGAGVAGATDGASPLPEPTGVVPSPSLAPSPAVGPEASPLISFPLPDGVTSVPSDVPTVSLEPTSEPGLGVGETVPFTLEHCGLLSPVDIDGSLWRPVGGVDPLDGPIDTDEEVGELINATEGWFTLVSEDRAEFRTVMGLVIHLERAAGALDYPLCM